MKAAVRTQLHSIRNHVDNILNEDTGQVSEFKLNGKVPCFFEYKLFESFTDAAIWVYENRPEYWIHMRNPHDKYRVLNNLVQKVRNMCFNYRKYGMAQHCWIPTSTAEMIYPECYIPAESLYLFEDLRKNTDVRFPDGTSIALSRYREINDEWESAIRRSA